MLSTLNAATKTCTVNFDQSVRIFTSNNMILQLLLSSPWLAFVWIVAIVLALTVHEFAHALVGVWRGDRTAEHMGRLTLNPVAHIDPMGFFMLIILGFGWAKPVPFDPRNLQNPLVDGLLIAMWRCLVRCSVRFLFCPCS